MYLLEISIFRFHGILGMFIVIFQGDVDLMACITEMITVLSYVAMRIRTYNRAHPVHVTLELQTLNQGNL